MDIKIDGEKHCALFDTGAELTLISGNRYDKNKQNKGPLTTSRIPLSTANGGRLQVRGEKVCQFEMIGQILKHKVIVVDGLSVDCIIGADMMEKFDISIDVGQRKICLGNWNNNLMRLGKIPLKAARTYVIEPYAERKVVMQRSGEIGSIKECLLIESITEKVTMTDAIYSNNHMHYSLAVRNLSDLPVTICRGEVIASGQNIDENRIYSPDCLEGRISSVHNINKVRKDETMYIAEMKKKLCSVPEMYNHMYKRVLHSYQDVFSINTNDVGRCDAIKQRIQLNDQNKVCSTPPYRLPHNLLPVAHAYVRKLLENDIIRPSKSPFSSPLMLVKKPGLIDPTKPIEEQYRVVHDYRRLNAITIKDAYPMRNLFELIDEVGQGKIFTIIDLSQGFWNQELEESSKHKTAFGVPGLGHFEYNRSAQGLCNSGAAFQRLLDYVTSGLKGVFVYIDDIVIVSKTHEEHVALLDQVLQRFRKFGLKCRLSKLQLATGEVNYLGYNISTRHGIRPGELKTKAIKQWQPPKDVKEIKQFLGLCSFFRRTIPFFSQLASPLTKLTRKDSTWTGGVLPTESLKAFCQLKQKLSCRPCLMPVDFSKPFILTVDSSGIGVGSILSQIDDHNIERPCAYASRVLTPAEEKYAPSHLEAAGLLWSCKHFRPYLIGREFTIRTDHKPLLALNKMNGFALDRVHAELQDYQPFKIIYLPGEKMPADGLSRMARTEICTLTQLKLPWTVHLTVDQLYHLQTEDKYIKAVVCAQRFNIWPKDARLRHFVRSLHGEVIFQQGVAGIIRNRVFLALAPYHIRATLLSLAHDDAYAGHMGWKKTLGRLQLAWYWPGMAEDVENYCQSCHVCQTTNLPHGKALAPLEPLPAVSRFNERVHVDLLGPLPASKNGNKYLLVMSDAFSSYMEVCPLKDKTADNVCTGLLNSWISNHTIPGRINSDLGAEFTANVFKELCNKLGIKQYFSSTMHPMSNGQVERLNRSILDYIRKFVAENQQWEELLPAIKFAMNTAPHSTKRYSPFQIVYGRRPTLSTTLLNPLTSYSEKDSILLLSTMAHVAQDVAKLQAEAFKNQKLMFDRRVRLNKILVGDLVYITRPHKGNLFQKFQQIFEGPYTVVECLDHQNYILKSEKGNKLIRVHHNRIKLAKYRWQMYDEVEPINQDENQEGLRRSKRLNIAHEEYLKNFQNDKKRPICDDDESPVGGADDEVLERGDGDQSDGLPTPPTPRSSGESLPSTPDSQRTVRGRGRRLEAGPELEAWDPFEVPEYPVEEVPIVQPEPGLPRREAIVFPPIPPRPPVQRQPAGAAGPPLVTDPPARGAIAKTLYKPPEVRKTKTKEPPRPRPEQLQIAPERQRLTRRQAEMKKIELPRVEDAPYPAERKKRQRKE